MMEIQGTRRHQALVTYMMLGTIVSILVLSLVLGMYSSVQVPKRVQVLRTWLPASCTVQQLHYPAPGDESLITADVRSHCALESSIRRSFTCTAY